MHNQGGGDEKWVLETDGLSLAQGGGAKIILRSSDGPAIAQAIKLNFKVSNNEAEYDAVILRLKVAKHLSIMAINLRCNSKLVASQLQGEYEAKNERME